MTALFLLLALPAFCEITEPITSPLEGGVFFDWISKTQMQRDENIKKVHDTVFTSTTALKVPKAEFRNQYADFLKDKNHIKNYEEISQGKKEDDNAFYCAFHLNDKSSLLIMYAIQYKNDLKHIYYYDAMGSLWFVDIFSPEYPNFPHCAYQYRTNGNLQAAYYYVSARDQYAFDENGKFRGRWYNGNFYNRKAKVIMTRTSW